MTDVAITSRCCNITEDSHLHAYCRENLKFHNILPVLFCVGNTGVVSYDFHTTVHSSRRGVVWTGFLTVIILISFYPSHPCFLTVCWHLELCERPHQPAHLYKLCPQVTSSPPIWHLEQYGNYSKLLWYIFSNIHFIHNLMLKLERYKVRTVLDS
jgi:hypothetical protein